MEKTQLVHRDPNDLQLHRLLEQFPEPERKSPEWKSFVESIRASGILQPLLITDDNLVMGGARRLLASLEIRMSEVPCFVRPEYEAGVIIVDGILQCRHMTRGAAVYFTLTMEEDFIKSANQRRLANLSNAGKSNQNSLKTPMSSNWTSEDTIREFCADRGISKTMFYDAKEVLGLLRGERCEQLAELFKKSFQKVPGIDALRLLQKTLRDEFEPELRSGDKNLWNVKSAIGSKISTQGKAFPQMEFVFSKSLGSLAKFRNSVEARRAVRAFLQGADDDQVERIFQLGTILKEEAQSRSKELTKEAHT